MPVNDTGLFGRATLYTPYQYKVKRQMDYSDKEKRKLVNRLSRLRGQVEAMRLALEQNTDCTALLQQATACRGALDGFIATVIEHHVRQHLVDPKQDAAERSKAAEELIHIVHAYLT